LLRPSSLREAGGTAPGRKSAFKRSNRLIIGALGGHLGRPEAGPERERPRGGNRTELGTPNACGPRHSGARSAGRPPS
jgi:hypothetical protein